MAPPGVRVLIHEKPQNRETWSPHALDGWYVGPALESLLLVLQYLGLGHTTRENLQHHLMVPNKSYHALGLLHQHCPCRHSQHCPGSAKPLS